MSPYSLSEAYETIIDYRVCHACWRPIAPGKPVYWKTDADGVPFPFHPACRN